MFLSKNVAKFYINFEGIRLKIKLNKCKSAKLTCGEFISLVLKKLKKVNEKLNLDLWDSYGLFERFKGIEMLIPENKLVMEMDGMIKDQADYIIRKKNFIEQNQKRNRLSESQKSKILSFFRQKERIKQTRDCFK